MGFYIQIQFSVTLSIHFRAWKLTKILKCELDIYVYIIKIYKINIKIQSVNFPVPDFGLYYTLLEA